MPKLTRSASKDLQRLPEPLRTKAKDIIRSLHDESVPGKRLRGKLEGKRSARLGRSHRIIFTLSHGEMVVLAIKQRKDAYR